MDIIHYYYGVDQRDIEDQIVENIEDNFHHKPMAVPSTSVSFWNQTSMNFFQEVFKALESTNIVSDEYEIKPHEWRVDVYPAVE